MTPELNQIPLDLLKIRVYDLSHLVNRSQQEINMIEEEIARRELVPHNPPPQNEAPKD